MPPLATALHRTAELLDQRVAAALAVEPQTRFVSSLHRPISSSCPRVRWRS
ncbi:hypothetical protein [Kitasatospora sp. NPDC127116]|uniref:hypothetical protein n=1 Tax=Kitasatospora sp. NPDC127116 TaxID=3345367 RepID=UPI00362E87D0